MDDDSVLNQQSCDIEQNGETDLSISMEYLQDLFKALTKITDEVEKQSPDLSYVIKDRYGVTVRYRDRGSQTFIQRKNIGMCIPILLSGRIFGNVYLSHDTVRLSDLDLAKIALTLTEMVEWVETESERRGVKIQKILKEGMNVETTHLLSLCGLNEENKYTVIAMELTVEPGKFLFVDTFRRFMMMRAWGYKNTFDFLAYWSTGLLVIYPKSQKEHWITKVEQWFQEWKEYQLQLTSDEPLPGKACIVTIEKLRKLDTVLHDIQMTMETANKLHLFGIVDLQVNHFSQVLSNLSEHILREFVHQTIGPILTKSNGDFIRTLWIFLLLNQNYTEAAQALFIHRNTLHYRIRQIEQLLHVHLHETKTIASLWLALQALQILESSGCHLLPRDVNDILQIPTSVDKSQEGH